MLNLMNTIAKPTTEKFTVTEEAQQELMEIGFCETWAKSVLAIYDRRPDGTLYAPVGMTESGQCAFADEPKYLFDDQIQVV